MGMLSAGKVKITLRQKREMEKNSTPLLVVAGALKSVEGRWLMHRRPLHKHHGGLWEFPGGKVELRETPRAALVRELREELGVAIALHEPEEEAHAASGSTASMPAIVILLYILRHWSGEPQALEGGEVAWFDPHEIDDLQKPPLDCELARRLFEKRGR